MYPRVAFSPACRRFACVYGRLVHEFICAPLFIHKATSHFIRGGISHSSDHVIASNGSLAYSKIIIIKLM